jgi:hypothetical protein
MKAIHGTAFRAMLRVASLLGGDFAGRLSISVRRIRRTSDAIHRRLAAAS